jgi:hypothetical protein
VQDCFKNISSSLLKDMREGYWRQMMSTTVGSEANFLLVVALQIGKLSATEQ